MLAATVTLTGGAIAQPGRPTSPLDSIARLTGQWAERDTGSRLAAGHLAALAPAERAVWQQYVARSEALLRGDLAAMRDELARVGRTAMTRAPYVHDFAVKPWMAVRWFATDSARHLADAILSYQAPSGGWSKHVDFAAGQRPMGGSYYSESADWAYIATLDNGGTTEEMRFLALADRARPDARYRASYLRGVRYLLDAQFPNGCWPQVYPLQGGYHDAATFNDDAIVHAVRTLREVATGEHAFVPDSLRRRAADASEQGIACIVASQVIVGGARTVWGQQHDPLRLQPVGARSYEPASLAGRESASITDFLMTLPSPDSSIVRAVHAAVAWFRSARIDGWTYHDFTLVRQKADAGAAGSLWARMYEIGTNRPIFSNRDGVRLYDWHQLTDRRSGYVWYSAEPASTLATYDDWARRHPPAPSQGAPGHGRGDRP